MSEEITTRIDANCLLDQSAVLYNEPLLHFSPYQEERVQFPIEGLQRYGPLDLNLGKRAFKKVRFSIVCLNDSEAIAAARQLISYLDQGIKYSQGFKQDFRLQDVKFPSSEDEFIVYDEDNDESSLNSTLNSAIRKMSNPFDPNKEILDLVITVGSEHVSRELTPIYYKFKRKFLSAGYPTQNHSTYSHGEVKGSMARIQCLPAAEFEPILRNIELSIYAKLGGIPWSLYNRLGDDEPIDLILGFRFGRVPAHYDPENAGGFAVGCVSIFGSDGFWYGIYTTRLKGKVRQFYQSRLTEGMTMDEEMACELITDTIDHFEQWYYGEKTVRSIVIHRNGWYGKRERKGLLRGIKKREVNKFALIELIGNHDHRLFLDNTQKNIRRGFCRALSRYSAILATTGDATYERFRQPYFNLHDLGTPQPLIVHIREKKNMFTDPVQACAHVFALTSLRWHSAWSAEYRFPATVEFADKVADHYKNGVFPHSNLQKTAWFL